jgi:hypothetical protein
MASNGLVHAESVKEVVDALVEPLRHEGMAKRPRKADARIHCRCGWLQRFLGCILKGGKRARQRASLDATAAD